MTTVVLVVDDNEEIRGVAAEALRGEGYDVIEASDAQSAVAALGDHPETDVLFTDIEMPGADGFGLAIIAVMLSPRIHVLYTSGRAKLSDPRRDAAIPCDLLEKPYRCNRLIAAVDEACRTPNTGHASLFRAQPRARISRASNL